MKLGIIGLGTMGGGMARRLIEGGHEVIGHDRDPEAVAAAADRGAVGCSSLDELIARLDAPRVAWLMLPAGDPVEKTIESLASRLEPGDVIVDGGNSNYKDTVRRAQWLDARGLRHVDVGTSGGVWGRKQGYSLMVGGEPDAVEILRPALETLAPAPDRGWGRVGSHGAGHFVKMVHNGIEYGLMQAYAEGFALLREKGEFEFNLPRIAGIWRSGSVIRSWLLDLTARALDENPDLSGIASHVEDSGEGRWTVQEAIDLAVPAPVISLALQMRFRSRIEDSFAAKLLAAMRREFGGHAVKEAAVKEARE